MGLVLTGGSPLHPGLTINFSNVGDSFTYHQLLQAVSDFNDGNLIKHNYTRDLFNGILESGIPVIIKRIDITSNRKDSYLQELDFFNKVSHSRFVPLLGHCLENENEKFLAYKYMLNGDLANYLYYRKTTFEDGILQSLDWITRLKIAIRTVDALSFLHHECNLPFVHRSFEQGTSGSSTSIYAYDVFCFGKVLLELVTGKLGISACSDAELKEWLEQMLPYISIYDNELVTKIVDPFMVVDEDFLEEVWAMAVVARSCLNPKPSRRPLMRYVLRVLENPLKVVREENSNFAWLRTTSSRGSWNAALFGSWRQNSSNVIIIPATSYTRLDGGGSFKHSGTIGSQGSYCHVGGDLLSSRRRHSKDIFPKSSGFQDGRMLEQD